MLIVLVSVILCHTKIIRLSKEDFKLNAGIIKNTLILGIVAFLIVECLPLQLVGIFGAGFALLLPVFFGLDGVLYSMPVSDIGSHYRDDVQVVVGERRF